MKQPAHPGPLIRAALRGSKVSQRVLASASDMTPSFLSQTLSDRHRMPPRLCLALERLGVGDADDWYSMYTRYELAQARKQSSTQTAQ